jgi:hypothetical protein
VYRRAARARQRPAARLRRADARAIASTPAQAHHAEVGSRSVGVTRAGAWTRAARREHRAPPSASAGIPVIHTPAGPDPNAAPITRGGRAEQRARPEVGVAAELDFRELPRP